MYFPCHSGLGDGVSILISEGDGLVPIVFISTSFSCTNRCHLFGELFATRAHKLGRILWFILLDVPEKLDDLLVVQ